MKQTIGTVFKNYLCMICASFMLVGCAYFDAAEPDVDDLAWSEPQSATAIASEPLQGPIDVADVIARATQGRVQLYNIDPIMPPNTNAMVNQGALLPMSPAAASSGPGVQIFPF
jgi:hypothetical protein